MYSRWHLLSFFSFFALCSINLVCSKKNIIFTSYSSSSPTPCETKRRKREKNKKKRNRLIVCSVCFYFDRVNSFQFQLFSSLFPTNFVCRKYSAHTVQHTPLCKNNKKKWRKWLIWNSKCLASRIFETKQNVKNSYKIWTCEQIPDIYHIELSGTYKTSNEGQANFIFSSKTFTLCLCVSFISILSKKKYMQIAVCRWKKVPNSSFSFPRSPDHKPHCLLYFFFQLKCTTSVETS